MTEWTHCQACTVHATADLRVTQRCVFPACQRMHAPHRPSKNRELWNPQSDTAEKAFMSSRVLTRSRNFRKSLAYILPEWSIKKTEIQYPTPNGPVCTYQPTPPPDPIPQGKVNLQLWNGHTTLMIGWVGRRWSRKSND